MTGSCFCKHKSAFLELNLKHWTTVPLVHDKWNYVLKALPVEEYRIKQEHHNAVRRSNMLSWKVPCLNGQTGTKSLDQRYMLSLSRLQWYSSNCQDITPKLMYCIFFTQSEKLTGLICFPQSGPCLNWLFLEDIRLGKADRSHFSGFL